MTPSPAALPVLTAVPYDDPEARRLTGALHAEQAGLYGFADDPSDTPPDDFAAPHGQFVIARYGDTPAAVGCGGWHLLTPGTAEVKRMYVSPAARGRGLGRYILQHLEEAATAHGATHVLLETGALNTAALALYRDCGYTLRKAYVPGRNTAVNRAMGKSLRDRRD
jgi:ribosomal protein S18 acetylase RimI-like enzyme